MCLYGLRTVHWSVVLINCAFFLCKTIIKHMNFEALIYFKAGGLMDMIIHEAVSKKLFVLSTAE